MMHACLLRHIYFTFLPLLINKMYVRIRIVVVMDEVRLFQENF
jgi:hypothetical protein